MAETPDYYAVLGVSPGATVQEISAAFSQKAQRFPKEERDPAQNPAFRELVAAHEVLSNEQSRAVWDQTVARYPQGKSGPLRVQLLASQTTLSAIDEPQALYLLLTVSADPTLAIKTVPVNLCLVVDRSTSMKGPRISQVKAAAALVVDRLQPHDSLSVITFSDRAEIVVPAGPVKNGALIKSKISQIFTGGATEMLQGLRTGLMELYKAKGLAQISHLILLTDGHTYGDESTCIELAGRAAANGIGISALGIGHQWNDAFLDALVAPSGNSSAYLESPKQVVGYLQERIQALNRVLAQDVHLRLDVPPRTAVRSVHKLGPFPHPVSWAGQEMPLGTIQHGVPLSVLIELLLQPVIPGSTANVRADIGANIIPGGEGHQHFFGQVELSFAHRAPPKPLPRAVVRAVQKLNLHLMHEKVYDEVEHGRVEEATRRMERLATRLSLSGKMRLAETALSEAEHISRTGKVSAAGRKKLKYGTRALIGDADLS